LPQFQKLKVFGAKNNISAKTRVHKYHGVAKVPEHIRSFGGHKNMLFKLV
jgi:hypothetical protein